MEGERDDGERGRRTEYIRGYNRTGNKNRTMIDEANKQTNKQTNKQCYVSIYTIITSISIINVMIVTGFVYNEVL